MRLTTGVKKHCSHHGQKERLKPPNWLKTRTTFKPQHPKTDSPGVNMTAFVSFILVFVVLSERTPDLWLRIVGDMAKHTQVNKSAVRHHFW